jgi:ADP-ribose pyrophosphatase
MIKKIPDYAEKVFEGVLHSVYQWKQEMFDGSQGIFEAIKRKDTVTTLAITKDKKIIVNNEEQPYKGKFIALSGGVCEEGETLLENAQRELSEETGYTSQDWRQWFSVDVLNSFKIDWNNHLFIAKGCELTMSQKLDAGERIEVQLYSFDEFIALTQNELFRNKEVSQLVKEVLESESKMKEFKDLLFL